MNRYDKSRAKEVVVGYHTPRPGERREDSFERAKAEAIRNLTYLTTMINQLTFAQFKDKRNS